MRGKIAYYESHVLTQTLKNVQIYALQLSKAFKDRAYIHIKKIKTRIDCTTVYILVIGVKKQFVSAPGTKTKGELFVLANVTTALRSFRSKLILHTTTLTLKLLI